MELGTATGTAQPDKRDALLACPVALQLAGVRRDLVTAKPQVTYLAMVGKAEKEEPGVRRSAGALEEERAGRIRGKRIYPPNYVS